MGESGDRVPKLHARYQQRKNSGHGRDPGGDTYRRQCCRESVSDER